MDNKKVETVSKILRNKRNVIRERVNIYKCMKCEGTHAGKSVNTCSDRKCRGNMKFWRCIPQEKVEEITSRRAARQCPGCMKIFYVWVENCPYCSVTTLKGKIANKNKNKLAKLYEHTMFK